MAMSNCKECGKQVSTTAKTCPNCGVPKPAKKLKKVSTTSKTKKKMKICCPNVRCSAWLVPVSVPQNKLSYYKCPRCGDGMKHYKKAIADDDRERVLGTIQKKTESEELVWTHCSNKKCGDYTQMYRIPISALAKRACIRCHEHLKKAKVIDYRPVMPTDGIYDKIQNEKKDSSEWSRTPSPGSSDYIDYINKKNKVKTTSEEKGTWETFLDGNLDLATSFWGFLIVGTFVVGFVCGWLSAAYGMGWFIPLAIYTFFAVGGTWASAENYKKKQLSKQQSVLWGILAQIVCVLNVISVISMLVDMF